MNNNELKRFSNILADIEKIGDCCKYCGLPLQITSAEAATIGKFSAPEFWFCKKCNLYTLREYSHGQTRVQ
jgi:hypothetical protein